MSRSLAQSPMALARGALCLARHSLPAYSSLYSRRDFTQHQLFSILALRQFFKTDYRGICQLLEDLSYSREVVELEKVPYYSTLSYAEAWLLKKISGRAVGGGS